MTNQRKRALESGSAALVALLLLSPGVLSAQTAVEAAAIRSNAAKNAAGAGGVRGPAAASPGLRRNAAPSTVQPGAVAPAGVAPPAAVVAAPTVLTPNPALPSQSSLPADNGPSCPGGLPEPTRIRLSAGKATLINLPEPISRRTLGDPVVVDGRMVSPQVMYLVAGRVGSTNAILQGVSGRCTVLEIVVSIDIESIRAKLTELMPNEKDIRITAAADSIVLSGSVGDALALEHVVSIANAYVRAAYQQGMAAPGAAGAGGGQGQTLVNGVAPLSVRVVNLLSVTAAQQVMLEVKVAEVAKTVLDKLGTSFNLAKTSGSLSYQLLSNFLTGTTGAGVGASRNATNNFLLEAQKKDGLIRILAEPNVMAISGQEGSFLAGGKILIPVSQNNGLTGNVVTLEEKEFGVGLKFTPTVLSDGRINLRVSPEVSELSRDGVGISIASNSGTSILPLITTRRASTTVQLYDGQSFAIGGLIKSTQAANLKAFPVLGEIPILGALFRSTDFQEEKTELIFVVTPRLVKPLPPDYSLPTDRVGEPTRQGILIDGRLDNPGTKPTTAPSSGMQIK
jgi:pilus assembly protein CpaC